MKLAIAVTSILLTVDAFVPMGQRPRSSFSIFNIADEFGIPCEEECAIERYPNLPESVHPGVLSGKALLDLLNHAKENGKSLIANFQQIFKIFVVNHG
jgi:fructose-bisphosphate aldolase, class II